MGRAISSGAAVGYATFARQHRLQFVGSFRREFLDVVDAELTEEGTAWLLVECADDFVLFTTIPLTHCLALETLSDNERDRRLADLLRSEKAIRVVLGEAE